MIAAMIGPVARVSNPCLGARVENPCYKALMSDSKNRFTNRVENYVKCRPDYPRKILAMLREKIALRPSWIVADVGSGTGISARMFLENGNSVFAIEPNAAMRAAAEEVLRGRAGFTSI